MSSDILDYIDAAQETVNERLRYWLDSQFHVAPDLADAMAYATFNGGKRLRPILAFATAEALGGRREDALDVACALEMVHSYSLVHDDLPAMDDDDLRRGKPTCHIQYDEATAILAGDSLQCLAFEVITTSDLPAMTAAVKLELIAALAKASGTLGMAGGQALDLAAEGQALTLNQLENIHLHKTGKLIQASVRMGAAVAHQTDPEQLTALSAYAKAIGLAFQVWDDVLDVIGDTATLGKTQGADAALNKATYPRIMGLDAAKDYAAKLHQEALQALQGFDHSADTLRALASYIVSRGH